MLRRIRHAIREFSYFSPSLKRGTWVLVGIIILLQIVLWSLRYYSRHYQSDIESMVLVTSDSVLALSNTTMLVDNQPDADIQVDPNTAPIELMIKMGFPAYIARRIVRYREKGGKFYSLNDICKIYGIDTALVYRWKDNWVFPQPIQAGRANKVMAERIEINSVDTATLEKLPGIGKALAVRIIKYRDLLGGYYSVEQLREVYGLSSEVYLRISSRLWADTTRMRILSVSKAPFRDLVRHPYIGLELAKKMEKYRKSKIQVSLDRLLQDSIITPKQADRLRRYCDFSNP